MFIKMGYPQKPGNNANPQAPLIGDLEDKFVAQGEVMRMLLVVALVSIPLMLLVNPCVNGRKADKEVHGEENEGGSRGKSIEDLAEGLLQPHEAHTFGELFIH